MKGFMLCVPFLSLLCLLTGCIGPSDVTAPNGYSIECDKQRDCVVLDGPHSVIVSPEVDRYAVSGQLLLGHSIKPADDKFDVTWPPNGSKGGYFLIDTSANSYYLGLDEQSWKQLLRRNGLSNIVLQPTSYKPRD